MNKAVSQRNIKIAFILVTSLFFLWGFSYGLLDVMNKNFQNQLGVTKGLSGLVQMAYFGGYFLIAIPASKVANKFGYKGGIIMGLLLYALGALMIVPSSNAHSFQLFLLSFFIIACGLGSLETNANPYITKLGAEKDASFRLNVAQSLNGFGSFIGPIVGGALFLSLAEGDIERNMQHVQWVYVGIAIVVLIVLFLFIITKMPEGVEVENPEDNIDDTTGASGSNYKKLFGYKHFSLGILAQFLYIAAQVGAGAFFINYSIEHWQGLTDEKAAYFLSVALALFMIGRVVTTPLMKKIDSNKILGVYAAINTVLVLLLPLVHGLLAVIVMWAIFFFMSISFPTIFALSLDHIPSHLVKDGSSFLVMSIVGGAISPTVMGHLADAFGTGMAFLILAPCFLYVAWYGFKGSTLEKPSLPATAAKEA